MYDVEVCGHFFSIMNEKKMLDPTFSTNFEISVISHFKMEMLMYVSNHCFFAFVFYLTIGLLFFNIFAQHHSFGMVE